MREHTRKHRTEKISNRDISKSKDAEAEQPINWREAAKEVFGNVTGAALNLRGLRNREGMTQLQLGQAIEVDQSNISKMERGERHIGVKIAKKLEKFFDIDYRLFL